MDRIRRQLEAGSKGSFPIFGVVGLALLFGADLRLAAATDQVFVVTSDFQSGSCSTLGLDPPWTANNDLEPICADAVARSYQGLVYVVNRFGCDNIQVLDPAQGYNTILEFSVGVGTNPQDIAFVSPQRAYVSLYETDFLREVNPQTGAWLNTLSLAPLADADGIPEAHRMTIVGDYLYVEVQRLDRNNGFVPVPPSYLAVIHLPTRTLIDVNPGMMGIQGIALLGTNPNAPIQYEVATGDLLVPTAGEYLNTADGGIERVDPRTWSSAGFVIEGSALGGDLVDFAQWSDHRALAIVSDLDFNTSLVAFDPSSGVSQGPVFEPSGFVLSDCLTHPLGYLYLSYRDFNDPGVLVFDAETADLLAGPIPTGLPPFELIRREDTTTDVAEDPLGTRRPSLIAAGPFPNPSSGEVRVLLAAAPVEEQGEVRPSTAPAARGWILDATGRVVRVLSPGLHQGHGARLLVWDGRDAAGRLAPAGAYWVRVARKGGEDEIRPIRILR